MAQQALGPGTSVPRRRALFGLLDADGWAWASVKAFVWLILIIFILGYLPDRAYYLTVGRHRRPRRPRLVADQPLPARRTRRCPARRRSAPLVPWQPSPAELALPAGRTDGAVVQVGTKLLYIGGIGRQDRAVDRLRRADRRDRQLRQVERRPVAAGAAGGRQRRLRRRQHLRDRWRDADGQADRHGLRPQPGQRRPARSATGSPSDALTLPEARAGAAVASRTDGLLLIGGAERRRARSRPPGRRSSTRQGALGAWSAEQPLVTPQTDAHGRARRRLPVGVRRQRRQRPGRRGPARRVRPGGRRGPARQPDEGKVIRWDVNNQANLPVARTNASGWGANGAIYLAGGNDGSGPKPRSTGRSRRPTGDLTEWKHLDASDLPAPGSRARRRHHRPERRSSSAARPSATRSWPRASGPTPRR